MPRVPIPIRAPFGGLQVNSAQRAVDPRDCVDCREVHTTFGSINKRPGIQIVSNTGIGGASGNAGMMLKPFRHGSNAYLLARINTAAQAMRVIDTNGFEVYSESAGSEATIGFATHNDRVYVAGGTLLRTLYTSGATFVTAQTGITAPTVAPTVTDIGAGGNIADGDYSYRYTYYNSTLGVESGPSPSGTVTAAGGSTTIRVTGPVGNGDSQISHYRIYRQRLTVDTTWYYVAQQTIAVNYDDTLGSVTGLQSDALNLISDRPPDSSVICWHNRRMWWGVGTATPRDIRPSEIDLPHKVNPLGGFRIVDNYGDYMIEAVSHRGRLFIFNLNSLWVITGRSLSSYSADQVAEIGCAARYSIVKIGGYLYFASRNGVYRTAGGEPEYLSADIEDLWRGLFDEGVFFTSMSAGYEPLSGCYVISAKNNGGSYARSLAFSVARGKWYEWSHGCNGFALFPEIVGQRPRLYTCRVVAPDSGTLHYFKDQEYDNGGAGNRTINWRWTTPNMDLGTTRDKRFFYASPSWDSGGNDPLSVDAAINHGVLANVGQINMNATRQRRPFRLGRMGNTLQLRLSGTSQNRVSVAGVDVEVEPIGNR